MPDGAACSHVQLVRTAVTLFVPSAQLLGVTDSRRAADSAGPRVCVSPSVISAGSGARGPVGGLGWSNAGRVARMRLPSGRRRTIDKFFKEREADLPISYRASWGDQGGLTDFAESQSGGAVSRNLRATWDDRPKNYTDSVYVVIRRVCLIRC